MARLLIPIAGGKSLLIGLETAGMPDSPSDWEVVRRVATFIGSWLAQEPSPAPGEHRRRAPRSDVVPIGGPLGRTSAIDDRLDVYALGTLRVERGRVMLRNWGGAKAGTRQAEGIFAFLFDRGERGAHKDEIIELIWPDVPLLRADTAFHRTIGGLRRTLSPSGSRPMAEVISFRNDRYHLNPELIRWSDVHEFDEQLDALCRTDEPETARLHLERARRLYRGDYLDDCPFYGDSSDVEGRRQMLRGHHIDVLIALATAHERRGNPLAAAQLFREALAANGNDCPPAERGLGRLPGAGQSVAAGNAERNLGDSRPRYPGLTGRPLARRACFGSSVGRRPVPDDGVGRVTRA